MRHNEFSALIEKEIEALPAKMRQVFELSRKEIAAELGMSEEIVKNHMHKTLKLLKVKLGPLLLLVFVING